MSNPISDLVDQLVPKGIAVSFTYHRVAVMDTHGNVWTGVLDDWYNTIQVYGLKDAAGASLHFEAEGYHISTWAAENGLKYWSADVNDSVVVEW